MLHETKDGIELQEISPPQHMLEWTCPETLLRLGRAISNGNEILAVFGNVAESNNPDLKQLHAAIMGYKYLSLFAEKYGYFDLPEQNHSPDSISAGFISVRSDIESIIIALEARQKPEVWRLNDVRDKFINLFEKLKTAFVNKVPPRDDVDMIWFSSGVIPGEDRRATVEVRNSPGLNFMLSGLFRQYAVLVKALKDLKDGKKILQVQEEPNAPNSITKILIRRLEDLLLSGIKFNHYQLIEIYYEVVAACIDYSKASWRTNLLQHDSSPLEPALTYGPDLAVYCIDSAILTNMTSEEEENGQELGDDGAAVENGSADGTTSHTHADTASTQPSDNEMETNVLDAAELSTNYLYTQSYLKGDVALQGLMTIFSWIKDLSKPLKQKILSSYGMERVLKILEADLYPHKFISDQLDRKSLEEISEKDHIEYQDQAFAQKCARQHEFDDSTLVAREIGPTINGGIFMDPLHSQAIDFNLPAVPDCIMCY